MTNMAPLNSGIRRTRLPYRTPRHWPGSVTLLRAPIGFGKTTLLRQWLGEALGRSERALWLSLTEVDREVEALAGAIARAGGQELSSPSGQDIEQLLTGDDATGRTLFIDNWDAIAGSESERLLSHIVGSDMMRADLVIAARRPCRLPIDRLLADDRLRMIGQNLLRFSESEQQRLLGPTLWGSVSIELRHACAGWPLALKLLRSIDHGADGDLRAPMVFAHESGLEAMIDRQLETACTNKETELLAMLGLCPDFDIALLNEIRDAADSGDLMEGVASLLPFDVHVGERGLRYRPSDLIRPIFRRRFDALGPARRKQIADTAFNKAISRGRTLDALNFALLYGDGEKAVGLLEAVGPLRLMMIYGVEAIQDVLNRLPIPLLATSYRSRLAVPVTYAKRGCLVEAREMVDATIRDIETAPIGQARKDLAMRDAVFVQMQIAACVDSSWADDYQQSAREKLSREPTFIGWSRVCSGIVHHQKGRLDAADADFEQAWISCEQAGAVYQLSHIRLHRAHVDLARGNHRIAARHLRDFRSDARADYPSDIGILATCEIARIEASLIASRASVQFDALTTVLANLRQGDGWYEPHASAFISMARCLWRDHGVDAVLHHLTEAELDIRSRGISHVSSTVTALKAFYLALNGRTAAADALLHADGEKDATTAFWRERQLRGLTMAMVAGARGDVDTALAIADAMIADSRSDGRKLSLVEAQLNRAHILADHATRREERLAALTTALELAHDLAAPGLLYEWHGLIEAEAAAIEPRLQSRTAEALRRLLAEWQGRIDGDLLSAKELSVLKAAAQGLSNKEISRSLDISVDTVKFHLKHCFRKLGAGTRAEAVERAHAARLM